MGEHNEPWEVRQFLGVWGIWDGAIQIIELGPEDKDRIRGERAVLCVNACAGWKDYEVKAIPQMAEAGIFVWNEYADSQAKLYALKADLDEAVACIKRLSSSEGFEAIGTFPDDMWGDEVRARIDYAKAFLTRTEGK